MAEITFQQQAQKLPIPGTVPIPKKSRPIKTNKPRPFLCSICTRGFVRHEHLKRHKISHTNEKPFLCIFCGRCFARKDLVLRHQYKLHPALVSQKDSKDSNSNTNSGSATNENIVKVTGNKQTILPTPLNPLAMTTAQLKKKNAAEKSNKVRKNSVSTTTRQQQKKDKLKPPVQKRKRHASFSASNAFTYRPNNVELSTIPSSTDLSSTENNNQLNNQTNINPDIVGMNQDLSQDVPHQVGFSTPQLSANRLLEKIFNSELAVNADILQFSLEDSFLTNNLPSNLPGFINNDIMNNKNNSNNNNNNTNNGQKKNDNQNKINDKNNDDKINNSNNHSIINDNGMSLAQSVTSMFNFFNNNNTNNINHNNHNNNNPTNLPRYIHHDNNTNQNNTDHSNQNIIRNDNNSINSSNYNNKVFAPSASFLSLANLLTIGPTGEGGYSNSDIILNNISKNNNSSSMSNLIDYFNYSQQNPILNHNNSSNNDSVSPKSEKQLDGNHYDEKWLSSFLAINPQFQNVDPDNYKISSKNFNEIGFVDPFSNTPSTISSDISSSSGSPTVMDQATVSSSTSFEKSASPKNTFVNNIPEVKVNGITSSTNMHSSFNKKRKNSRASSKRKGSVVSSFFSSRQHDIFTEDTNFLNSIINQNLIPTNYSQGFESITKTNALYIGNQQSATKFVETRDHFTEEIRQHIITENNLKCDLFPTVTELNSYVNLYILKFHPYFPFIHLGSLTAGKDNYAFILSLTVIGALFGFHSSHAMLLSKVAWFQIKNTITNLRQTHTYSDIPLWVLQSMVLLIFINIFNNDLSDNQKNIIHTQLMTVIELVKLTKINLPIEVVETPPIDSDHYMDFHDNPEIISKFEAQINSIEQVKKNFDYFIKAQSRIRTCHTILIISNMFTTMVGLESSFHSIDVKCGIPCNLAELFDCKDENEWQRLLRENNITIDSKFSLLELSNGGETYENCLNYLANGNNFLYENEKLSLKTLLSLLVTIHEKIFLERNKISQKFQRNTLNSELFWRMNARPVIESALKNWEALYLKNGGILVPNENNISMIYENPESLMVIPLYALANIRKCLDLTVVMSTIWLQDWEKMNKILEKKILYCDLDSLHEATDYALSVINFWVNSVSITQNAKTTSRRTPIFALLSIFVSIFLISEQMKRIEDWAIAVDNNCLTPSSLPPVLKTSDRIAWLRCEKILKKVEMHLLPKGYNKETYAEFLRIQANGALDVDVLDDRLAENAMKQETSIDETVYVIKNARLSSRCLYLGVRILGDAPIWPIALLLAHALQSRAVYKSKHQNDNNPVNIHDQFNTMNVETYYNSTSGAYYDDTEKEKDEDDGILTF
ncbi:hypothetical protein Kpol_1001p1 [Vanderwaltozyma polyspora DSM 70294]|uniref:C2H2-type domain-containing protein n=1 Tax=Vanderwaltozyma polyspora (strain ATCC 22028 / DSM 70294 / BCRC 21397 / CBS 2163 / NBRC 10782 / NRRL Y-8283 / UCD 57-17) TaxID=436907 RepID=A7TNN8_VANPO|nr:uncharacterized protein Kpol_1001p1 [Vanderwaltozyma polyspora DSM 70294]EDO16089.1 hypothetical protein Kpol_1001p1 [Vanderwaltozyma polyspora DSM 70294]